MQPFFLILFWAGVGLLVLGGLAGAALFLRAIGSSQEKASWAVSTLWGLFLACTIGGLIIIAALATR